MTKQPRRNLLDRFQLWFATRSSQRAKVDPAEEQQEQEARRREALARDLARRPSESADPSSPAVPGEPSAARATTARRVAVPWALDLAAAWAWRLIVVSVATLALLWLVRFFAVVVFPLVLALFVAALALPVVQGLQRLGLPRKLSALIVVLAGLVVMGLLFTFVGQQISSQSDELFDNLVDAVGEVGGWLQTGPLGLTDSQLTQALATTQEWLAEQGSGLTSKVPEVGIAVGHTVAGFFIILFATYFFLADGRGIWSWVVRIFPAASRHQLDSSGTIAWTSLNQFVRATVVVAATDALAVMLIALILKVPLVTVIGVLIFIGGFVPIVGAFVSGAVAVLLALVAQGPFVALLMFAGVVVVAQLEAHVLQPFLMGRFVSVHPLGVIVAIAAGIVVAGVPGALVAVPLAAALNAVVVHLANQPPAAEP